MKDKLLNNAEITAIALMGFVALIVGGWSVLILVVLAGTLIGVSVEPDPAGLRRAGVSGAIGAASIVVITFLHNTVITQLPRQDAIPAAAQSALVYLGSIVLGAGVAVLVAFLRGHPDARVRRYGLLALVLAAAVIFPFFEKQSQLFWANTIIVAMIYALQALGLNIVAGYAGMLDLGYVAFFAIGGYTMALLNSPQLNIHMLFWLVIWIAAAAAAVSGLILGAPVLPLRGDYLAIVTLGFGEIVPIVFKNLEAVTIFEPVTYLLGNLMGRPEMAVCLVGCSEPLDLTNGTQGINPIGRPEMFEGLIAFFKNPPFNTDLTFLPGNYLPWYFLILALLAASIFFISRLRRSRIGRAWVAIREDELAANAMGVNLVRTKLTAFMIGAMFSGFAGAFYASYVSFVSPEGFDFSISVIVLCMVILGGTGSITGVLLGAFIIKVVDLLLLDKFQAVLGGVLQVTVFRGLESPDVQLFLASLLDATQYKLLLFGLILVLMMQFRPQGLVPSLSQKRR
jgi:branched-chain amino acid transport system permease protein